MTATTEDTSMNPEFALIEPRDRMCRHPSNELDWGALHWEDPRETEPEDGAGTQLLAGCRLGGLDYTVEAFAVEMRDGVQQAVCEYAEDAFNSYSAGAMPDGPFQTFELVRYPGKRWVAFLSPNGE